ncbi:MAG: apolipoprotein N-acyltransferase [Calditrichaeota bacterium]|nr:apolipoprotein N-acyltransferase [Calditrichota bacterium]
MKRNLTLSLLTGILIALALPPFKTGFLAYGALIPFFLLLENKRGFEAFRWSYVTGLFIDIFSLFWIGWVTLPGLLGALIALPLFVALFGVLHTFLLGRISIYAYALSPFLWTAIEYLQSFGEIAFPWTYLGYTQTYYLPLIQYAEFTGVYGVSFWVAGFNVILFLLWKDFRQHQLKGIPIAIAVLWMVLPLSYGYYRLQTACSSKEHIKIALVQGNIDPFEKWDLDLYNRNFQVYDRLMRQAAQSEPDLIIWPETATPFYLRYEHKFRNRVHFLVDSINIPLLTGSVDYSFDREGNYKYYNSAFLFEPKTRRIQSYNKMQLVPFSERVPYSQFLPVHLLQKFLYDLKLGVGDYTRGKKYKVLSFKYSGHLGIIRSSKRKNNEIRLAVAICYESVFPEIVRKFIQKKDADFLAIITNDAWFGKTTAPFQHAQIAVFRAIENRVPVARCANTGISCFIDAFGHVSSSTKLFREAIVVHDLPLRDKVTFYTKHGNVFARLVAIIAIFSLITGLIVQRFQK